MNELIKLGRRRTILVSISILIISIHTIYFYQSERPEIEVKKLIQQIIRFLLTFGLLAMVYKGKNWAKNIALILFSFAVIGAFFSLITIDNSLNNKTPLLVMIFVYSIAIYHFGFAKSFKAFFKYQNNIIETNESIKNPNQLMNPE